jgi:serine/threonine protein kinase
MADVTPGQTTVSEVDFVALPAGEKIGRYEVLAVLGQGGFGITYRARDTQLGREVAIKEYLPTSLAVRQNGSTVLPRSTKVADDFSWGRERFIAEGRTLATLDQAPGIVRVFDFLELNGTAYIVMEMLQGDTLDAHLRKHGRMDAEAIDAILWTLLDGLQQVHDAGFLHRDIKPANILLNARGAPTLIDFGASRAAMADRTAAMTAIFTPGYAAAEQMTSAKQGPWTDVYGLSATLYHAIVGHPPPNAFERMLDDTCQPIAKLAPPGFARGLLAGIDAGLAVRASDRPQSIAGWRPILRMAGPVSNDATWVIGSTGAAPAAPTTAPAPVTAPAPAAPPAAAAAPAKGKGRIAVYAAAAVAILLLLLGGGYFALAPKPAPTGVALQDLKIEELEKVLAERRAADALAAEKRRAEEEALRKAEAEAAAKRQADADLEQARVARQKAEEELAKLKAEIDARRLAEASQREQADAVAKRAAEEAAQRKAEAEMAALRQAEEDARRKAAADAEAKRQADEALARAQAERQKADAEAKAKAEAEAKEMAEANARQIAEAEAKAKAEAAALDERKAAEAAEAALRLSPVDRQRLKIALTAAGFDTRGSDGAFNPRTRDMIAAWQKARNQPATGFLTAAQQQTLLKEAAAAIAKFDDEQKKAEEKKADEARKKAEDDAKKAASPAPAPAPPATAAAPAAGQTRWTGEFGCARWRSSRAVTITVTGGQGSQTLTRPGWDSTATFTISGSNLSGNISWVYDDKRTFVGSMSATIAGNSVTTSAPIRATQKAGNPRADEDYCTLSLTSR